MEKKRFDSRIKTAINGMEPPRTLFGNFAIWVLWAFSSLFYLVATLYEPGSKGTLLVNYCQHQAVLGCFFLPGEMIPGGEWLRITHLWIPWAGFVRQILMLPTGIITFYLTWWLKNARHWRIYWFFIFLFRLSFVCVIAVWGEGLIDFGLPDFGWREIIALLNLGLVVLILSMSLWNKGFLTKLLIFERFAILIGLLGAGGGMIGIFFGRYLSKNIFYFPMIIFGGIFNILIIIVTGKRMSEHLWNANPWRLEREMQAEEAGRDSSPWQKINISGMM